MLCGIGIHKWAYSFGYKIIEGRRMTKRTCKKCGKIEYVKYKD